MIVGMQQSALGKSKKSNGSNNPNKSMDASRVTSFNLIKNTSMSELRTNSNASSQPGGLICRAGFG